MTKEELFKELTPDEQKVFDQFVAEQTKRAAEEKPQDGIRDQQDFAQLHWEATAKAYEMIKREFPDFRKKLPQKEDDKRTRDQKLQVLVRAAMTHDMSAYGAAYSAMATNESERAFNETTPADGGLAIPPSVSVDIMHHAEAHGKWTDCNIIPVGSNTHKITGLLTDVSMSSTAEEAAITPSSGTIEQPTITVKKFAGLSYFSSEVLADTTPNFYNTWVQRYGIAIAKKRDQAVFNDGVDFTDLFAETTNRDAATDIAVDPATFGYSNLMAGMALMPDSLTAGAKFYGHRSTFWSYLYGMLDDNNRPIFVPSLVQNTLGGLPVEMVEAMDNIGSVASGEGYLAFGNLKFSCHIADRNQLSLSVSDQFKFSTDQITLRVIDRFGFLCYVPRTDASTRVGLAVWKKP